MRTASSPQKTAALPGVVKDVLVFAYVTVTIGALVPIGSVNIEPFAILASAMFVLALLAAILVGVPQKTRGLFQTALALLVLLLLWMIAQVVDLSAVGLANPIWRDAGQLTGRTAGSISIAPSETLVAALQVAAPFMTFMTGLILSTSDERAESILRALTVTAGLIALLTLGEFLAYPQYLLFLEKRHYLSDFTAVFVNRNSAATYLGVTALMLTGFVWQSLPRGGFATMGTPVGRPGSGSRRGSPGWAMFYGALLAATLGGLFLTNSRAGIASAILALLFLVPFLAFIWNNRPKHAMSTHKPSRARRLLQLTLAVALVLLLAFVFSAKVQLRASLQGLDDGRFCVLPGIIDAASANWPAGMGFGTFRQGFPAFRQPECGITNVWDRAHNFYMEGQVGLGLIFVPVLLVAVGALILAFIKGIRTRQRSRHFPALGVAILLLVGFHSLLDFSLQIPGFAIYVAALLAPLTAIALGRSRSKRHRLEKRNLISA